MQILNIGVLSMPLRRSRHVRRRRRSSNLFLILIAAVLAAALLVGIFFLLRAKSKANVSEQPPTTETTVQVATGEWIAPTGFSATEGWFLYNQCAYYGNAEGKISSGAHTVDGTQYTFADDGKLQSGWIQIGNLRYHFKDGVMSKGTTEIDGKTCYLNSDGSMFVGWYDAANGYRMYYDLETGVAFTGWHEIDGKHYCFDAAGFLYKDTTADGVPVDTTGAADEAAYQRLVGNTPASSGSVNQQTTTTAKAVDTDALNKKLDAVLKQYGRTPKNIYDYVHDHYTYKHAAEGSIEENALYLMENGTGSCYHFAALTYLLFKRAGYDTRYVTGLGWQNHTYHCWIMANFDGGWYFVDSLYVRSAKLTASDLKRIGYEWDEAAYPAAVVS